MATRHSTLTTTNLHQPFHYEQASDPGAVGANKWWCDTDNVVLNRRNTANTAWVNFNRGLTNANFLPSGIDGTDIQDAIDDAASGDIIVLPDEVITCTTPIYAQGKSLTIMGAGSTCEVRTVGNVSQFGTGAIFALGAWDGEATTTSNLRLTGFKITCTRADTSARTNAIMIGARIDNIILDHMRFEGITSTCILIVGSLTPATSSKVTIVHNVADEFWEQFVEIRAGDIEKVTVAYNTVSTSNVSPSFGGATKPYGVIITLEAGSDRTVNEYTIAYNDIDFSGLTGTDRINSNVIQISEAVDKPNLQTNINVLGNTIVGGDAALKVQYMHGEFGDYADDLTSYWTMTESGATARADSHSTNHLAVTGTVGQADGPDAGRYMGLRTAPKAAFFDSGTPGQLSIADNAAVSTGDISFTVAVAVYVTELSVNDMGIAGRWDAGQLEWRLFIRGDNNKFEFDLSSNGSSVTGGVVGFGLGTVSAGTWYILIARHNATANTVSLHGWNGTDVVQSDVESYSGGALDGTSALRAGILGADANTYFDGRMCRLGFWKRALTDAEEIAVIHDGTGLSYNGIRSGGQKSVMTINNNHISGHLTNPIRVDLVGYENIDDKLIIMNNQLVQNASEALVRLESTREVDYILYNNIDPTA